MGDLNFPNASEFSPNVIELDKLLELCNKHKGKNTEFLQDVKTKYFLTKDPKSQDQLTKNCRSSLVAYNILAKNEIKLTEFGEELLQSSKDSQEMYDLFAKHILFNLNGLILVDTVKAMFLASKTVTNENIIEELNIQGASISKSSKKINTMKLWLTQAGVFEVKSWRVNQDKLNELIGLTECEISIFSDLTQEQISFLKALNDTGVETSQIASDIKELAKNTYNIDFKEKVFSQQVLNPLEKKGLINVIRTTQGRGAKSPKIEPTEMFKKEITIPYLEQLKLLTNRELIKFFQLSFTEILEKINSEDTYIKGLALEALGFKIMKLLGLKFVETRLKSQQTGGAEVDLIFENTKLVYSRWQVQCKNTKDIKLEDIAKEVGISLLLKTSVIVMIGTGKIGNKAREYANTIMKESNLCIIMIDGKDIEKISENPSKVTEIFNREAKNAKHIKMLNNK
ncbi:restriction endonuclease [Romboutsia sp. 1001713B170131_170501_G6]|uniref:restriction endonuclease n=1 Tax=Romboutsia sp. 1001713B170131_170501_G6 TaxID=2787108 RepID=UPI0018A8D5E0|nr:restriction endonuclease [Romboutsia sp. 1001713B170131_170501_G6]